MTNDEQAIDEAVVVVARYRVQAGAEDTVNTLLAEYSALVRAEPGCAAFSAHRAREDPREFVLFEHYRDRTAFDHHVASTHYASIARDRIRPLLEHRDVALYGGAVGS
jgi:quinol monooxygenase YgiN